jgi:hypothetical protein
MVRVSGTEASGDETGGRKMRHHKRKAAVAALITAGAIVIGAVTGGAFSSPQALRDSRPPWCPPKVVCIGREQALTVRKAGKGQQEYIALPVAKVRPGMG